MLLSGQQERPLHSPAVATEHPDTDTDTDAQQTTPQECRAMPYGLPNPTSSAEDGDSRVGFDPTDDENSTSSESPSALELATAAEDRDNQFDPGPTDDEESASSVSPSVFEFPEENGRTYHKFKAGRYPLPNDEEEQNRLDLQHQLFLLTQRQKLLLCPVDLSRVHRALDLGTGTGIWALDFGDANPQSKVLGVDLSPIQPEWVLLNVSFRINDIEDIVILSLCSSYHLLLISQWLYMFKLDLIHGRMLAYSIRDWPRLFKQSFR